MPLRLEVLDYVVLIVTDLDRSLSFYTGTLGLTLKHRAETYAQLDAGTTRLGLYARDAMRTTLGVEFAPPSPGAPAFELGFKVSDCDAAFAELVAAGVSPVTPPTTRPWGQRTAYVRDPDGNLIELAEDLVDRRRPG
jgi:catechol 2,3-dioxygenase-like lactoylglutathione lyase family enzyme